MSLMVSLCCPVFDEMSWIRSEAELSQFLGIFLPTLIVSNISTGEDILKSRKEIFLLARIY